jgi:MarR family transcriptional regulator, transcriptional regulator for hemolysin
MTYPQIENEFLLEMPLGFLLNTAGRLILEQTVYALRDVGVDPPQLGVLWLVDSRPGETQTVYARLQKRDATTFGRLVDRLEAQGLIRRGNTPDDRRAHLLELTAAGQKVLVAGKKKAMEIEMNFASRISKEELLDLKIKLSRLLDTESGKQ